MQVFKHIESSIICIEYPVFSLKFNLIRNKNHKFHTLVFTAICPQLEVQERLEKRFLCPFHLLRSFHILHLNSHKVA